MGGDNSPTEPIQGIKSYINDSLDRNIFFYIVGDGKKASDLLKNSIPEEQYQIINTSQVIEMDDKPSEVLKSKPDSSMLKCLHLVKESKASAIISSGNTGALLLGSSIIIKKIPEIRKAILAPIIPNKSGNFILALEEGLAGELWIGTNNGLSKFDGKTFQNFSRINGLESKFIFSLESTKDHSLWIGGHKTLTRIIINPETGNPLNLQ